MAKVTITITDDIIDGEPATSVSADFDPPLERDVESSAEHEDMTQAQEAGMIMLQALHEHLAGDDDDDDENVIAYRLKDLDTGKSETIKLARPAKED